MQKKQPHVDSAASKSEPNVAKSPSSQKPEKKMKMVYIVELVYSWKLCYYYRIALTQPFNGPLSGTTQVDRFQKWHSPTQTHPDHQTSFVSFLHLLWSIASSWFNLHASLSFSQPLSNSSLVYLLVWNPLLHTPYISSLNCYLLILEMCNFSD